MGTAISSPRVVRPQMVRETASCRDEGCENESVRPGASQFVANHAVAATDQQRPLMAI